MRITQQYLDSPNVLDVVVEEEEDQEDEVEEDVEDEEQEGKDDVNIEAEKKFNQVRCQGRRHNGHSIIHELDTLHWIDDSSTAAL